MASRTNTFVFFLAIVASYPAVCDEYLVREKTWYGGESLELQRAEVTGQSVESIFNSLTTFSDNRFNIRILDPLSPETKKEIIAYLKIHHVNDSDTPENTSINFSSAFKSTEVYRQFSTQLEQQGYSISDVTFEKLRVSNNEVSVSEISLRCEKAI